MNAIAIILPLLFQPSDVAFSHPPANPHAVHSITGNGANVLDPENPAFSAPPTIASKRISAQTLTGWRAKAMNRDQAADVLANVADNLASLNSSEASAPYGLILQARWAVFQAARLSSLTTREQLFELVRTRHPEVSTQWLSFLDRETKAREGQILPDYRLLEPEVAFMTLEQVKGPEARSYAYFAFSFLGDDYHGRWPLAFYNPDRVKIGTTGETVQVTGPDGKALPSLSMGRDSAESSRNIKKWLENENVRPFYFLFATAQLTTNPDVIAIADQLLTGYTIKR